MKLKIKSKVTKTVLIVVAAVVLVAALAGAGYFYKKYNDLKKSPDTIAKEETDKLVASVGKLMALPTDETPSIATVTDKEKLKDQPFFAKAENNDKVLIYTKAKKAILYRPSTNKIVEVMPIAFNDTTAATPAPATPEVKK
ncbi:MAG TPA: hypothetical protein P5096_02645 [Patescibacteria group bacterium]|nr:hypothetical protein [Patescibacteria group bacterium]